MGVQNKMSEIISYLLEFLIDGTQIDRDTLEKDIAKTLGKYTSSVDWDVIQTTSQHFKLSIRGSLEDVDACHNRINKEFVNRYSCIRLRDEAGDEIRQKAYPILAHIEQQLRAFINRAMIEVKGVDWWDSIAPFLDGQRIQDGVQKIEGQIGKTASALHHPLELTLFEDLIRIVTGSIQYWPTGKPLSADDLLEILPNCSSLDDFQKKLLKKTRKISLWNEVFARYFDDVGKWKEIEEDLTNLVIPVRHKVMHHRPMHLWELQKLQEAQHSLDTLLGSAATKLSEEERAQALRVSEDWLSAFVSTLGELVLPVLKVSDVMEAFWKQQEGWSRALREPENAIQRFGKLFWDRQQIDHAALFMAQYAISNTGYVGSTGSIRFHRPTCRYVNRILPNNRIRFTDRDEAVSKGYVPCQTCKP